MPLEPDRQRTVTQAFEEPDCAVEFTAPDITAHRQGNTGVPWFTTRDSGHSGPHTMITALTHGNEICGAVVVDDLMRQNLQPSRGQLTLGFLNVAAYGRFDPAVPYASRFVDEDLNRVWDRKTLDAARQSIELDRARAVRPILETVDYLLDIHSMQQEAPPLVLAGMCDKSTDLARRVGFPPLVIRDKGHAAGRRLRDYGAFGDPASSRTALLVECGRHWASASVNVARETAFRFLQALGQLDAGLEMPRRDETPDIIEVTDAITARTDDFSFERDFSGVETIAHAGTLIGRDGPHEVRTPYDACVLIMPGRFVKAGQTAVRLGRYLGSVAL